MKIDRVVKIYDYVDENGQLVKISAEFNGMFPSMTIMMRFMDEIDKLTSNMYNLFERRRLEPGKTLLTTFTHSIYC